MEWVLDIIIQNQISNIDCAEALQLFHSDSIEIRNFDLIMITNITQEDKKFEIFRILEGGGATLFGVHLVTWNNETFYVSNLSTLKEYFFQFHDKLSFERCTFLMLPEQKKLVRLKNIRYLLKIDPTPFMQELKIYTRPNRWAMKINQFRHQKKSNDQMFLRQKCRIRDSLLTTYRRKYPDKDFYVLMTLIEHDFLSCMMELESKMEEVKAEEEGKSVCSLEELAQEISNDFPDDNNL